ncbi:MAG: chorismate lyase [Pseudomonadota bacterium]
MNKWIAEPWRSGASVNHCAIPAALRAWLFERRSLTRKLRAHCAGRVGVRVLSHTWGPVTRSERTALGLGERTRAYVRQVELACAGRVVIFARTVMPPMTVAARRHLTRLGNRALGDVLFADRSTRRGTLSVARLPQGHLAWLTSTTHQVPAWGRRSIFTLGHAPLLVSEFFLDTP